MKRAEVFDTLADFTFDQRGLFTRAQASSASISDQVLEYFLRAGDLVRVARGVYRFRRDLPRPHEDVWAAWLQLAPEQTAYERTHVRGVPDVVVSHATAAHIYDLGVLFPQRHEFTVSTPRRTRRSDVRLRRAELSETEWELVDGLPTTRPARIAADLLHEHRDLDHIAHVTADALDRGLTTRVELAAALAPFTADHGQPARDGTPMLDMLLTEDVAELER